MNPKPIRLIPTDFMLMRNFLLFWTTISNITCTN